MFVFIFTEISVLLIIIFLLFMLSWVWPPDSPWAPWWQMPPTIIEKMCKMAKVSSKDTIYDLGCGTGKALIYSAKTFSAKGVGIEIDPIRFQLAKWNVTRANLSSPTRSGIQEIDSRLRGNDRGKIILFRKNFFDVSLTPATIIFVYLVPAALKRLTPKFLKELKPKTKFISYVYPMPQDLFKGRLTLVTYNKENRIFYYQLLAKSKK